MSNEPNFQDPKEAATTAINQARRTDDLFNLRTTPILTDEYEKFDNRRLYRDHVSQSSKTIIAYFRFVYNQTCSQSITALISELLRSSDICRSTFNKKRAAYCLFLEYAMVNGLNAPYALSLYKALKSFNSCRLPSRGKLTCSRRRKSVNLADHEALTNYFYSKKSKYSRLTALLHGINIYWGLRLCEWKSARLMVLDGKRVMRVTNAKQSNGRANGRYRIIECNHYNQAILDLTAASIRIYQSLLSTTSNGTIMGGIGREYLEANKALFPTRKTKISFYSTRHQFSSNYKAWSKENGKLGENFDERKLAALMGHGSSTTPYRHYGKSHNSWHASGSWGPHTLPEPGAANLANVRNQNFSTRRTRLLSKARHTPVTR